MAPYHGERMPWEGEILKLKERIAALEGDLRRLRDILLPDIAVAQPATPHPFIHAGCVCPAGAEVGCGSIVCPRRGLPNMVRA